MSPSRKSCETVGMLASCFKCVTKKGESKTMKKKLFNSVAALGLLCGLSAMSASSAQAADLTLCWAAWDPANALVELSKDFEAKSGNKMKFEFVPWPNFADRMLNELNSGGKLCDLLIGDSQWIGGAAENKQYIKLNDFFDKNNISMKDFIPATVTGYAEWPKGIQIGRASCRERV